MIEREGCTYVVSIYMAGDIHQAKRELRKECYPPNQGLCVTVEPTSYIYSGGEEAGFRVGLVNYPRFPTDHDALFARARGIAERLIPVLCQWSALIVAPDRSVWLSVRPEGKGD